MRGQHLGFGHQIVRQRSCVYQYSSDRRRVRKGERTVGVARGDIVVKVNQVVSFDVTSEAIVAITNNQRKVERLELRRAPLPVT